MTTTGQSATSEGKDDTHCTLGHLVKDSGDLGSNILRLASWFDCIGIDYERRKFCTENFGFCYVTSYWFSTAVKGSSEALQLEKWCSDD